MRGWMGSILAACLALPAAAAPGRDAETRAEMVEIVEALAFVLPLSLSDERFADPARRAEIRHHLERLARSGRRLEAHGADRDAGFAQLSRSLARESAEILERFQDERFAESAFLLHELTDQCVACHSRLPDPEPHPLGLRLVARAEVTALPLDERVRLEMATRQFDAAMDHSEELFADPAASPADLDLTGLLDDYVEIGLRVLDDPARVEAGLGVLAARDDLPGRLESHLATWRRSLRLWAARSKTGTPLERAREALGRAHDRERFQDDRAALIVYVGASSELHRFVASGDASGEELAESYYLLGRVESRVGRSLWLSQTEHYLEAAIRAAPAAPFASDAYALLEEVTIAAYTGSAGRDVPADEKARLDELRAVIEAAREPPQVAPPASR